MQAYRSEERNGGNSSGSDTQSVAGTNLNTSFNAADVVEILGEAHERTTKKMLNSLDKQPEITSGEQLLKNAEMHGISREELQRAIAEKIREKQASDPLSSTRETEKVRLGLPEDVTTADVVKEKGLRKQVDEIIEGLTGQLDRLLDSGMDKGLTGEKTWLDPDNKRIKIPEWLTYRDDATPWQIAARSLACLAGGSLILGFVTPAMLGVSAGALLLGMFSDVHHEELAKKGEVKVVLTKPTNSPAMNDLFVFCKNNGISIETFKENGAKFFGFKI